MTYYIMERENGVVKILLFDNYNCQNVTMNEDVFEIWKKNKKEIDLHENLMNDIKGKKVY